MKKSILDLLKFIALLLVLIVSVDFVTSLVIDKNVDFTLTSRPKYIIVGNSHPECAYDDSLISDFKNLSESAETYFYTYFKLKKVLEQNDSIKTVFIEYTNNQILLDSNEWIWSHMVISNRYPKYGPFMDIRDALLLFKNNPSGYLNAFSYFNREKISIILESDYDYSKKIGGYLSLARNTLFTNDPESLSRDNVVPVSEINLSYLSRIIDLAKLHGVEIILVRSPLHKKYSGYAYEAQYQEILKERFPGIEYLDFANFPATDAEFGDFEHLNNVGAPRFSKWFDGLLKDGLLEQEDKQKFIEERMDREKMP